jgi:hypothetical protein
MGGRFLRLPKNLKKFPHRAPRVAGIDGENDQGEEEDVVEDDEDEEDEEDEEEEEEEEEEEVKKPTSGSKNKRSLPF